MSARDWIRAVEMLKSLCAAVAAAGALACAGQASAEVTVVFEGLIEDAWGGPEDYFHGGFTLKAPYLADFDRWLGKPEEALTSCFAKIYGVDVACGGASYLHAAGEDYDRVSFGGFQWIFDPGVLTSIGTFYSTEAAAYGRTATLSICGEFEPHPPAPVPEPATWAMMLMGFFGLGSVLRRRRYASSATS
jgi:hypothetical protein